MKNLDHLRGSDRIAELLRLYHVASPASSLNKVHQPRPAPLNRRAVSPEAQITLELGV